MERKRRKKARKGGNGERADPTVTLVVADEWVIKWVAMN